MSKVIALYHIVFCTKNRKQTITNEYREDVYRFIWNIVKEYKCELKRISGTPNHIHMMIDLNPMVALSNLMRDVKAKSSGWMARDSRFKKFEGWAREYYAATLSYEHRDAVIEYIKFQQAHHNVESFDDELDKLLKPIGLQMYKDDLM